jgi:hypothetical protein
MRLSCLYNNLFLSIVACLIKKLILLYLQYHQSFFGGLPLEKSPFHKALFVSESFF